MSRASTASPPDKRGSGGAFAPLIAGILAVVAATIAFGAISLASGHELGTPLPPFQLSFDPRLSFYLLAGVAVLGGGIPVARALTRSSLGPAGFAAASFGLTVALRLALNASRGGPHGWYQVFEVGPTGEGRHEYLAALPEAHAGLGRFLDHFAELAPGLPTHPSSHPPGLIVVLDALRINGAQGAAYLVIGIAALSAPLLYLIGRDLFDEQTGRIAALLFAFAPSSLLYGATSADALFCTLALAAAGALVAGRAWIRTAGPVLLAIASFFSYALLAAGAWAVLFTWMRRGLRAAAITAMQCAAAVVAFYLVLHLTTGFDIFGSLHAANDRYRIGIAGIRPYAFWLWGSPVAFLVALGVPITWQAVRSLSRGEASAVAIAAVIALSSVIGYTKAETERIWLFMVPFVCLAAARSLRDSAPGWTLALLALQALLVEVLFFTIW